MSGPEFLLAYPLALAFALLLVGIAWLELQSLCRRAPSRPLDLDELAYLAGGRHRVVHLVVARLLADGSLRASRSTRRVKAVHGASAGSDLDRAVLEGADRTVAALERGLADHHAVTDVVDRVDAIVRMNPRRVRFLTIMTLAPVALVFGAGVLRLIEGIAGGHPVGWLIVELVFTLPVLRGMAGRMRESVDFTWWRSDRHPLVRAGNYTVREADHMAGAAVLAVALEGLVAFPDEDVRRALLPEPAPASTSADGAGAGGVGFAVASSCGGGCGGCGGCGG